MCVTEFLSQNYVGTSRFPHEHSLFHFSFLDVTTAPRNIKSKGKGKSPITGLDRPREFQEVNVPDFMTTAQDGGKVVSLTHRPPSPPRNTPGTHFC